MSEPGVKCISLRKINKGALLAFCDLEVPAWHLVLRDCKWFSSPKGQWIGLPSTSFTNREGKTVYKNLVEFSDPRAADRFGVAALDAVRQLDRNEGSNIAPFRRGAA